MLDPEAAVGQGGVVEEPGALAHPALEMLVSGTDLVQLFQKGLISNCSWSQAFFIQHGQDSSLVLKFQSKSFSTCFHHSTKRREFTFSTSGTQENIL